MTDTVEKIAKVVGGMTSAEKRVLRGTLATMDAAEKLAQKALAETGSRFSNEITLLTSSGTTIKLAGHRDAKRCLAAMRSHGWIEATARHVWMRDGVELKQVGDAFAVVMP